MFDETVEKKQRKEVWEAISEMHKNSISKFEIFNQLSGKYPDFPKDTLAKSISSFITEKVKYENRIPVYLLVASVIISIFFGVINFSFIVQKEYFVITLMAALIIWCLMILFAQGFYKYKLFFYTTAVSLYSLLIPYSVLVILFVRTSGNLVLELLITIINLLFIYLLRANIFPNINFWGNVKKDKNKNYIF